MPNELRSSPPPTIVPLQPLRVRIAWSLLVLLALAKFAYAFDPTNRPELFMLAAFGPMAIGALTGVWWLGFSQASAREPWQGWAELVLLGLLGYFAADKSMRGMPFFFYAYPLALALFLLSISLLGRWCSTWRTKLAVLAVLVVMSYNALLRLDGITGSFAAQISYRWESTAEERLLVAHNATRPTSPTANSSTLGTVTWSEFRGPRRDAVVPGVTLASDWQTTPLSELWRRPIGPGWSSFAIAGQRLFTQEQRGDAEWVVCYNTETGHELWHHATPARFWESIAGAGPRATPTLAHEALFTLGATGMLTCFDPVTGQVKWQRNIQDDAQREPPTWGFCASPLVVGDVIVVHAGGKDDRGLLAYSIADGQPYWRAASGDHSYSSPHRATIAGRTVVLMLTNTGLTAHEPDTGKLLWEHSWKFDGYRCVQPLSLAKSQLLLGTGMGMGSRLITLSDEGDTTRIETLWTSLEMKPDYNDYVAHAGFLYGFDHNIFACIELATGKRKWKKGRYGNGQVLLLPDAEQLLVLSEEGELVLLKTNPDQLEELTRQRVLHGKTWNHPALVGDRIYVRNDEEMAAFVLPLTH